MENEFLLFNNPRMTYNLSRRSVAFRLRNVSANDKRPYCGSAVVSFNSLWNCYHSFVFTDGQDQGCEVVPGTLECASPYLWATSRHNFLEYPSSFFHLKVPLFLLLTPKISVAHRSVEKDLNSIWGLA